VEYRRLGRTGVRVSCIGLGCAMFGGRTSPEEAFNIIDRALDAGVNFLDTSNLYNRGRSEEIVGEALRRNGRRSQVVLATKVGLPVGRGPNDAGLSRRHIVAQCEASLRRLQTDYIDLYQLHRPRSDIPIDETLRALDDLIRAGKVCYIGTSTFAAWQVVEALWASERYGLHRFVCEQAPYNLLDRRIERELIPMAQTFGIAVTVWSPLADGLLTGKYGRHQPPPPDSRVANFRAVMREPRTIPDGVWAIVEGLQQLATAKGCTPSQLSLAWVMHQPGVTCPIIGPRTMEQLEDNLGALRVSLTADDRSRIDELIPPGRMVMSYYESDFGPAQFRW
jgi:aryl-alcohol dehydrogenase-like predicted oxidoreductase